MKKAALLVWLVPMLAGACATPLAEVPIILDGYRTGEMVSPQECERRSGGLVTSPAETYCSLPLLIFLPDEPGSKLP